MTPERAGCYNTDVGGLVNALTAAGVGEIDRAVVLGAGATARSTLVSLARLGVREVTVVARTPAKAAPLQPLAEELQVTLTCSSGTRRRRSATCWCRRPRPAPPTPGRRSWADASGAVFDVIYHPWPTPLAQAAAARNRVVLNGLDLLVHQAVLQIELMTGSSVPASVLYAAGNSALASA